MSSKPGFAGIRSRLPQQIPHAVEHRCAFGQHFQPRLNESSDELFQIRIGFLKFRLRRRRAEQVDEQTVDLVIVGELIRDDS